jgi:hypothetical protein
MHANRAVGDRMPERCNIGPEEVARRRRGAIVLTAVAVVVAGGMLVAHVPGPWRLLIWPVASAAAVTWLQVVHRFCVAFGTAGLENFGQLGGEQPVDPRLRRMDQRRALQLILEAGLIGLVVALGVSAIPI